MYLPRQKCIGQAPAGQAAATNKVPPDRPFGPQTGVGQNKWRLSLTVEGSDPYIFAVIRGIFNPLFVSILLISGVAWGAPAPGPAPGSAGSPDAMLQKAERAYEQLEYKPALRLLIKVIQDKAATPLHRARAFLYMGVCFTALGNSQNAVAAFAEVLKLRPNFRIPPGVSPSIRAMFNAALKQLKLPETPAPGPPPGAQGQPGQGQPGQGQPGQGHGQPPPRAPSGPPVEITATSGRSAVAGKPIDVKIVLKDPAKRVTQLAIRWRRRGGADYSTIKVKRTAKQKELSATIPGITIGEKAGTLAYYVEARNPRDQPVATAGSEFEPLEVILTKAEEKTGKSKWGWWALAIGGGVAAVAGGIVAAVLLTRGDAPIPPGNHAYVDIVVK